MKWKNKKTVEKSMKRKIDSLVEKKINKFGKIQEKLTKIKTEKKQVTNPQMKEATATDLRNIEKITLHS